MRRLTPAVALGLAALLIAAPASAGTNTGTRDSYDEKETAFRADCRPIAGNSSFYDLDELERCFGRTDSAS
ncbi:hypothetical protein EAO75_41475 [Streptomyces sp. uw30]|uniref:hypothetical protein n=1 Tax=Streptomyces sp. uw30 TaxID=1828179 RepID=UPI0011CD6E6D|nr:hypothetical protein [Streptomyces sp. uw30]TXS41271.1 hypothetical protein EAO75_41475 [Streptomyces sp. uw30]